MSYWGASPYRVGKKCLKKFHACYRIRIFRHFANQGMSKCISLPLKGALREPQGLGGVGEGDWRSFSPHHKVGSAPRGTLTLRPATLSLPTLRGDPERPPWFDLAHHSKPKALSLSNGPKGRRAPL